MPRFSPFCPLKLPNLDIFCREINKKITGSGIAKKQQVNDNEYTSSRITTQRKKFFKYGRIDIRAAMPQGKGIWPALWMLGANFSSVGWPACGEIDIMELVGQKPNEVFGTLHWANAGGDRVCTCGDSNSYYRLSSGTFTDEWHVFSLQWTENSIAWLIDDQSHRSSK